MFAPRYFPARYFAGRYFANGDEGGAAFADLSGTAAGTSTATGAAVVSVGANSAGWWPRPDRIIARVAGHAGGTCAVDGRLVGTRRIPAAKPRAHAISDEDAEAFLLVLMAA